MTTTTTKEVVLEDGTFMNGLLSPFGAMKDKKTTTQSNIGLGVTIVVSVSALWFIAIEPLMRKMSKRNSIAIARTIPDAVIPESNFDESTFGKLSAEQIQRLIAS